MKLAGELELLSEKIEKCERCRLHENRENAVPGEGDEDPSIVLVGEAPGENEDIEGTPFVGRAGGLLEEILGEVGLERDDVFITNVVKCRPPENRDPRKDEIETCRPYLEKQIDHLEPDVIAALGNHATETLTGEKGMKGLHGKEFEYEGVVLIPMYHPAAGLYNPNLKETMIEDMKALGKYREGQ